jgi:hypothetical protein
MEGMRRDGKIGFNKSVQKIVGGQRQVMADEKEKRAWANNFEILNTQEKGVEVAECSKDSEIEVSIHNILGTALNNACTLHADSRDKGKGKLGEDVDNSKRGFSATKADK